MKPYYFAEIGLNHMGDRKILGTLKEKLLKKDIHGISIQILRDDFYKKNFVKLKLNNITLVNFIRDVKKKGKLIGVATNDASRINFFKKLNIDFYKVLSSDIKNIDLIKSLINTNCKKIFLSTGLANFNEIKFTLDRISKKKISLIHTSFKKEKIDLNLKRMTKLKKKFGLPICYGNHSKYLKSLIDVRKYKPYGIFFYVKLDKKLNYPDNIHALNADKINSYL